MRAMAWVACAAVAVSCAPKGQPILELTLAPKTVTDATPVQVKVAGAKGDGTVGSGKVKITSARGSLLTPVELTLDGFGTAHAALICDPTTEPECAQSVRVVADWTSDGVAVSTEARLNSSTTMGTGGGYFGTTGGGAGGSGGGAGGGPGGTSIASTRCGAGQPGITGACCFDVGAGAPPCGTVIVRGGTTVSIPYVSLDGGNQTNVQVRFNAINPADAGDCLDTNFSLDTLDSGFPSGIIFFSCSDWLIQPDGSWQLNTSGSCQSGGSNVDLVTSCGEIFSKGANGNAHMMEGGQIFVGSEVYLQADRTPYAFIIRH